MFPRQSRFRQAGHNILRQYTKRLLAGLICWAGVNRLDSLTFDAMAASEAVHPWGLIPNLLPVVVVMPLPVFPMFAYSTVVVLMFEKTDLQAPF
jgi:hypothetical protein